MDAEELQPEAPKSSPSGGEAIRYPLADLNGELVWARDLAAAGDRPSGLCCVGCGGALTLRAGASRRPHFAHRTPDPCAGGETALHRTTIRVIADALQAAAREGRPIPIELSCLGCDASRPGDLARDSSMVVEVNRVLSNGIRPDILVRGGDGTPKIVIEVVVTHSPEEGALAEFDALGLTAIAVYPTWDTLEAMRTGLLHLPGDPDQVAHLELLGRCPFGRHLTEADGELRPCSKCSAPARVLTVEVSEAPCWSSRCTRKVRVLDIYTRLNGRRVLVAAGAGDLRGVDAVAGAAGVRLQHRYSKMAMTSYLMNVCECGAPSGDNFVYAGLGSEIYSVSLADPIRRYVVCESGHWIPLEARAWHPSTRAGRSESPVGLIGESANLFGESPEEPLVTFTNFATPREAARFLAWGIR